MTEPRLRVKPPIRDIPRNVAEKTTYTAFYRFRTGHVRSPKQCRNCGSIFHAHLCGGPIKE